SSLRTACASARVFTRAEVIERIRKAEMKKGDVLATARIAGIMAAKKTSELIPLCHLLALRYVMVDFVLHDSGEIEIHPLCRLQAQTGVEMEGLTAASVAALTIYDMCKAVDRDMLISNIRLEEKEGGKSGHWQRQGGTPHA